MPDEEALNRRLRAVERSLTDGDHQVEALRDAGALADRVETLESQLADAEDRIAELEAVTQALRGYVGNVRSVNEDVERRADAALAAVERLEERFDGASQPQSGTHQSPVRRRAMDRTQPQIPDLTRTTDESETDEADEAGSVFGRVRNAL